jgi:hypothetical protein
VRGAGHRRDQAVARLALSTASPRSAAPATASSA